MPTSLRFLAFLVVLLMPMVGSIAAPPEVEADADTATPTRDTDPQTEGSKRESDISGPTAAQGRWKPFVPSEKVSPDQIVSFPADI